MTLSRALQWLLVAILQIYRHVISPLKSALFGPLGRCRFTPSCSNYALEAVRTHGPFRGSWLALRRLLRCHPWGDCGHDPVPAPGSTPYPRPQPRPGTPTARTPTHSLLPASTPAGSCPSGNR